MRQQVFACLFNRQSGCRSPADQCKSLYLIIMMLAIYNNKHKLITLIHTYIDYTHFPTHVSSTAHHPTLTHHHYPQPTPTHQPTAQAFISQCRPAHLHSHSKGKNEDNLQSTVYIEPV